MSATLSPSELARYSRQIILPQVGREGQERLAGARVLVVGMGGLGSPASLYLAAAGVGTLGLADFDQVEEHNLQRQVLHRTRDVGRPKVHSAAERLRDLNPHTVLVPHLEGVTVGNAEALFRQYDLIVDGTDNFPVRFLNNDAAVLTGRPLVYGSIFQFEGQVSVFHAASGGACYRCLFPRLPEPGSVPNCAEAGVFGALCAVVGGFQAMEAIKWITGAGDLLRNRILRIDALRAVVRTVAIKPDPDCPVCGTHPTITRLEAGSYEFACQAGAVHDTGMNLDAGSVYPSEITPEEALGWLTGDHGRRALVLDVREPFEVEIGRIEGSLHIPLRELPDRWKDLPRDRPIIAQCHHGMRSQRATEFLRARGLPAVMNLAGGIDAWSDQIDPSIPRY